MHSVQVFELVIAMFLAIIVLHYVAHRLSLPPAIALLPVAAPWPSCPACRSSRSTPSWCW